MMEKMQETEEGIKGEKKRMYRHLKGKRSGNLILGSLFFIALLLSFLVYQKKEKEGEKHLLLDSGIAIHTYDSQIVADMALLCKVWGFLKYYHPVVVAGEKYNWDFELLTGFIIRMDGKHSASVLSPMLS